MQVIKLKGFENKGLPVHLGDGNKQVFSKVFENYYAALCLFAGRMVGPKNAEDVIEELFVGLWNKGREFKDEEHLKAFLYHAAKNACLDFIKSDQRANERNTVYANLKGTFDDHYLSEITRTEIIRELHQAIAELPPQCSKIISMGYLEGLSNAEIAKKLGLSLQTVKNQKGHAISLLKKRLPGDEFLMLFLLLAQMQ